LRGPPGLVGDCCLRGDGEGRTGGAGREEADGGVDGAVLLDSKYDEGKQGDVVEAGGRVVVLEGVGDVGPGGQDEGQGQRGDDLAPEVKGFFREPVGIGIDDMGILDIGDVALDAGEVCFRDKGDEGSVDYQQVFDSGDAGSWDIGEADFGKEGGLADNAASMDGDISVEEERARTRLSRLTREGISAEANKGVGKFDSEAESYRYIGAESGFIKGAEHAPRVATEVNGGEGMFDVAAESSRNIGAESGFIEGAEDRLVDRCALACPWHGRLFTGQEEGRIGRSSEDRAEWARMVKWRAEGVVRLLNYDNGARGDFASSEADSGASEYSGGASTEQCCRPSCDAELVDAKGVVDKDAVATGKEKKKKEKTIRKRQRRKKRARKNAWRRLLRPRPGASSATSAYRRTATGWRRRKAASRGWKRTEATARPRGRHI
jgi:hypothetical protein